MTPGMIVMPEGPKFHNACNEPCDMLIGPCICGANHTLDTWKSAQIQKIVPLLSDEDRDAIMTYTIGRIAEIQEINGI